jgi:hypothetical protein
VLKQMFIKIILVKNVVIAKIGTYNAREAKRIGRIL